MKTLLLLFFVCSTSLTHAQKIVVKGQLTSSGGKPVPYPLIRNMNDNAGIYGDSSGSFTISCQVNDVIEISKNNFQAIKISVKGDSFLNIVLQNNSKAASDEKQVVIDNKLNDAFTGHTNFNPQYNSSNATQAGQAKFNGSYFPVNKEKEETKGSRYLFADWASGSITDSKNILINDPAYLFNYDKIAGTLLLTHDKQSAIEVDKDEVKAFTLIDKRNNNSYTFERVPEIDDVHFVEVIAEGNKYNVYKSVKTKFIPANYTNNGLTSSGNEYDEYTDEIVYYLFNVKTKELKKFSLKKKSIKEAFEDDQARLAKFTGTSNSTIDEQYIKSLAVYMNG